MCGLPSGRRKPRHPARPKNNPLTRRATPQGSGKKGRAVGKGRVKGMANFHAPIKPNLSRSKGQSAVASAAYNAREQLTDERTGEVKDYSRAQGLLFSGIFTPANAPAWAHDRGKLWNEVERVEDRKDSQLARPIELALPHELTNEQRRFLVQDFVREQFVRKGYVVDVAIHAPNRKGDQRNYHAHLLIPLRLMDENGFDKHKKQEQWIYKNRTQYTLDFREKWANITNCHLARYGHEARIDHRSLKDQGIDREPTQHLGPYATQLERDGERSERGDINRDIEARNNERKEAQREYEAAQAEREQWEEKIALAAIQKDEEEQKKERQAEQDKNKNAELGKAAAEIRLAVTFSKGGESFKTALAERCLVLSQVSEQEAAAFERAAAYAEAIGHHAPRYNAGELVVINQFGGIHRLTERTTGKTREELDKYLVQIKRESLPNAEQGKQEAVMLGQYKKRAELLEKQAQQKAALEKQQAERKEQREKQAKEFEEKVKQDIDARLAGKHLSDKHSLERKLEENNTPLFGRLKERVKQFIGHKIDEHNAEKQKEKLHKAIIEKEWGNISGDESRVKRLDKSHDRAQATVEIKQAETREKMGIKAPERDEPLKAAQRTATATAFSKAAEQTTKPRDYGFPDPEKVRKADEERQKPALQERKESALDKTIRAVGKGREAIGNAGREAKKSIRVIDKATGVVTGLSNGVASILDGIARPVEAFAEGLANMFGGASPADERKTSLERTLQAMEERAAREEALENICESLKGGDDIRAADLRNLPREDLERIREGGDEYLQNMARQFERERDDWGRERDDWGRERER